jgi:hypothetical protein
MDRRSRFREQNPDTAEPDEAWLSSSYATALAAAQARAAVGTKPKPSAGYEEAYKAAIRTRLGEKEWERYGPLIRFAVNTGVREVPLLVHV